MLSVDNLYWAEQKRNSRSKKMHTHVTEYVKKLLNVMEYEVPYTSTVLMEKLGLKSKETFRKNLHESGYGTSVGTNDNSRKTEK